MKCDLDFDEWEDEGFLKRGCVNETDLAESQVIDIQCQMRLGFPRFPPNLKRRLWVMRGVE